MRIPAVADGFPAGIRDARKVIPSEFTLCALLSPCSLRLLLAAALVWLSAGWLPAANYELAVSSKMTEIRWKEADLLAAQRELDIINQFVESYPANKANLDAARQQLRDSDDKLRDINTKNLLKSTMTLGLETVCTIADTVSLGKAAASALITTGLRSAAGAIALDRIQDKAKNDGKTALGVDDATLTKPRVAKIKAVSEAARASFPDLAKVQEAFALTEAQVRQIKIDQDGVAFADGNSTGPIYYKNGLIREAIALALAKLDTLSTEGGAGKTDADANKLLVQADVDRLTAELAALNTELSNLNAQWSSEEAAARLAANEAAAVVPPSRSPSPESLLQGTDTDAVFQARIAAIQAAALNAWNTESPGLRASIAARKTLINTAQVALDEAVATYVTNVHLVPFLNTYGGNATMSGNPNLDPNTTASYLGAAKSYAEIEQWITAVTPSGPALPGLIAQAEALADQYTTLQNLKNDFDCLAQMVEDSKVSMGSSDWRSVDYAAGSGQVAAEAAAVTLNQHLNLFSTALAAACAQRDQLALATDTWSEVIEGIKNVGADGGPGDGSTVGGLGREIDANLVAAEAALADLISRGAAWENLLAAAAGLVLEPLAPGSNDGMNPPRGRLGYYSSNGTGTPTYIPVVMHAFDMQTYNFSMLAAIETPGAPGLAAARALRAKYDVLAAGAPAIKAAYDAAWIKYQVAYAKVAEFSGGGSPGLPVLSDWAGAAAYTSNTHPVNASAVTDQAVRYSDLYHTSNSGFATSLAGGPPVENEATLSWSGLPKMRQLTDPGLDDPNAYLPHRLADMKAVIVEDGESWLPLPSIDFNSHYIATSDAVWVLIHLGEAWADDYSTPTLTANKLMAELAALNVAYLAAHPLPTITVQPVGGTIESGGTHQLSVTATSDLLTYQWLMSMSDDANGGWQVLTGETARTLATAALTGSRWFHVIIRNPGGEITSNDAHVIVNGGTSSSPAFTSANSTTGQVGTPFTWTFTTNPAGTIGIPPNSIPPWLALSNNGTLSGTPTSAGTWDLTVTAMVPSMPIPPNPPSPPATATQSFHLTIALPPFDEWIHSWTTAQQRLSSAFTSANGTPAGDGVANLLKYAFNMLGNGAGQAASLDIPCSAGLPVVGMDTNGHLTLLYSRRKAAAQPGITYQIEFSSTMAADSWSANASASEVATSVDATWERVLVTDSVLNSRSRFVRIRVNKP